MTEFKPKNIEYRIARSFKVIFDQILSKSNVISEEQKRELRKDLHAFKSDYQIQDEIIDEAFGFYFSMWKQENFQLVELWKKICVQNSSANNEPHLTADASIEAFKETFKIN